MSTECRFDRINISVTLCCQTKFPQYFLFLSDCHWDYWIKREVVSYFVIFVQMPICFMQIIILLKKLTLQKAWSKCESSFCVDGWGGGRLTINILQSMWKDDCQCAWRGNNLSSIPVARGMKRWLLFCVKRWSPISIPGGSTINMERINTHHFTVHMNCRSWGPENYAALLSPCEALGCK